MAKLESASESTSDKRYKGTINDDHPHPSGLAFTKAEYETSLKASCQSPQIFKTPSLGSHRPAINTFQVIRAVTVATSKQLLHVSLKEIRRQGLALAKAAASRMPPHIKVMIMILR